MWAKSMSDRAIAASMALLVALLWLALVLPALLWLARSTPAAAQPAAAQPPPSKQLAARIELHPIQTLTLSDEQFLKGDSAAPAVTVSGQLRIAQGSGRLPVVMMIHGSGGIGSNFDMWSNELLAMGVSAFAIDGFTGRGLTAVATDQALLGRLNLILDAYRALEILARHPRVDPARITLMGFSRGGQAALFASLKRFHQTWNKSGVEFAAYVPFYPDCMTTYLTDTEVVDRPIRVFHGTPDDYNPVAPCKAYVARLRAAGKDALLTEYAHAQHAFDVPLLPLAPTVSRGAQTVRRCTIREESTGQLINTATGSVFTYNDACVERGPHIGHDPAATQEAMRSVREFLALTFKRP
jgi:dienelactone hydrolase